jgi:hypothetical protein
MRFLAPARDEVDPAVFARPPLAQWREFAALLTGAWPELDALNAWARRRALGPRFVAQTRALLGDGRHYEERIAAGAIATRQSNWHDLLNALVWLRFAAIKTALNARQLAEIARIGRKRRSRAQCALTHFDEAGVIVWLADAALLAAWDAHDWHELFWRRRAAWRDGGAGAIVFGHALLEHALRPRQLLVGKALAVVVRQSGNVEDAATRAVAAAIRDGTALNDPQELRPLPLSGIPGWHGDNTVAAFYRSAPCFRPVRPGRRYPPPLQS